MDTNRANLDQLHSDTRYLFLTILLVILSAVGVFLFFKIQALSGPTTPAPVESTPTPEIVPPEPTAEIIPVISETLQPTITEVPVSTTSPGPEPTPAFKSYDGAEDGFTLTYMSDRQVYKIVEPTGHRIAFYRIGGNIAVHVGTDWSWSHPSRELTNGQALSGQPAFRYEINTQTLVDVKYKDRFYTIQCLHNADESLKSECQQLITSFKFL